MWTEGIFNSGEFYRSLFGVGGSIQSQHEITSSRYRADKLGDRGQSVHAMWQVTRMRRVLDMVRSMLREPAATPADAVSASSLGLSPTGSGTPATVESTEEINAGTAAPSLLTTTPQAIGSTAQAAIGGTYDAVNNPVDTVRINKNDTLDQSYAIANGLSLTLGEGNLLEGTTYSVEVEAGGGEIAVNPDNPFNGTGTGGAGFEPHLNVTSGSFDINGATIAVREEDTVNTVLDRISASEAGVTASYTSASGLASITSKKDETALTLNGGGSGFFPALNIIEGTYEPREEEVQAVGDGVFERADNLMNLVHTYGSDGSEQVFGVRDGSEARTRMLGSLVGEIADAMNALFDDEALAGTPTAMTERLRNEVRGAVSAAFGTGGPRFDTDLGINLDFHATKEGIFKFSPADREVLETVLTTSEGEASLNKMFFGSGSDGLLKYLDDAMADAQTSLESEIGCVGHFLDEFV